MIQNPGEANWKDYEVEEPWFFGRYLVKAGGFLSDFLQMCLNFCSGINVNATWCVSYYTNNSLLGQINKGFKLNDTSSPVVQLFVMISCL